MTRFVKIINGAVSVVGSHMDTTGYTEVTVDAGDWNASGAPDWWVIDSGAVRVPTAAEITARALASSQAAAVAALTDARDLALDAISVEINGVNIWATPSVEQDICGRLRSMGARSQASTSWIQRDAQGIPQTYTMTLAELQSVCDQGTEQGAVIWDQYILDVQAVYNV